MSTRAPGLLDVLSGVLLLLATCCSSPPAAGGHPPPVQTPAAPTAPGVPTPDPPVRQRATDVARGEAMIDAGANGIFGHHSHRLQPLGSHAGRPIAWGLGNVVWPTRSEAGSTTAVARFVVEPDGAVHGCLLPARTVSPGHPELTGPRDCP